MTDEFDELIENFRAAETDDDARLALIEIHTDLLNGLRGMAVRIVRYRPWATYPMLKLMATTGRVRGDLERGVISEEQQHKIKYRALRWRIAYPLA